MNSEQYKLVILGHPFLKNPIYADEGGITVGVTAHTRLTYLLQLSLGALQFDLWPPPPLDSWKPWKPRKLSGKPEEPEIPVKPKEPEIPEEPGKHKEPEIPGKHEEPEIPEEPEEP